MNSHRQRLELEIRNRVASISMNLEMLGLDGIAAEMRSRCVGDSLIELGRLETYLLLAAAEASHER